MKEWEDFLKGYGFVPGQLAGCRDGIVRLHLSRIVWQGKLPAIMRMII